MTRPFIRTSLNPHHPRMLCAKLGWNWPSACGEENFLISLVYFCYFVIMFPFERGVTLHLNKLKYPLPKDVLCLLWLKLWFWRRRWKCEKLTLRQTDRETDRQTDDMRSEKLTMERLRIRLSFIIGFYKLFKHAFWMKIWDPSHEFSNSLHSRKPWQFTKNNINC